MELAKELQTDPFKPTSDDHILKFDVDEDIVIAKDAEGNELARLAFEYDGRLVHFKTPIISKYPAFVKKLALLFSYLAQYAPNLEMPDNNIEFFNNNVGNELWERLSSVAVCAHPRVKKMILELFFEYLDGKIDGLTLHKKNTGHLVITKKNLSNFRKLGLKTILEWGLYKKSFQLACVLMIL